MAAAAALPLSVALWGQSAEGSIGSGVGTAVMKCGHFKDAMIVIPGLSNSPTDQVVHAHGRVYGCNKAGGGGKFTANMTTSGATCNNRHFSGTATFAWANGRSSIVSIMFVPAPGAPRKVEVFGTVTSGYFDGLLLHSFVRTTDTFKGSGAGCSPSNLLKRIEFTNSQSLQLFTPIVPTTTTQPPTPPSTSRVGPQGSTATTAVQSRVTFPNAGGTGSGSGGGSLALTGSNSSAGAWLGVESLVIGGAVWAIGGQRRRYDRRPARRRRGARAREGVRPWLWVSLPDDRA